MTTARDVRNELRKRVVQEKAAFYPIEKLDEKTRRAYLEGTR